jgi:hypothetical protein
MKISDFFFYAAFAVGMFGTHMATLFGIAAAREEVDGFPGLVIACVSGTAALYGWYYILKSWGM